MPFCRTEENLELEKHRSLHSWRIVDEHENGHGMLIPANSSRLERIETDRSHGITILTYLTEETDRRGQVPQRAAGQRTRAQDSIAGMARWSWRSFFCMKPHMHLTGIAMASVGYKAIAPSHDSKDIRSSEADNGPLQ